jgi:hypothetical protein
VRVFIDEHLDVRLYQLFGGNFDAETADYRGWKGAQNGELMRRAAAEYDAFVTNDQNIPHQQNIAALDLRVVVLIAPSHKVEDLEPLVPDVEKALREMAPGDVRYVEAPA